MPTRWRALALPLLIVLAATVLLEGCERLARARLGQQAEIEALWIWDADWPRQPVRPHALQAVRQLELEGPAPRARLLIAGDEEYLAYLNGAWIGANAFAERGSWDAYSVGRWLRTGTNELTVELRSGRGVGGLLLCLELEPGQGCAVRSDASWRIHGEYRIPGTPRSEEGRPPLVWGEAHVGWWQVPRTIVQRPLFVDCVDFASAFVMHANVDRGTEAMLRDDGVAAEVPVRRMRWRHPAEGVFVLDLEGGEERQVAQLRVVPRVDPLEPDDPRLVLVTQPGQGRYASVGAYRFWSVEVVGEVEIANAYVHPVLEGAGCEALEAAERVVPEGLWGYPPPLVSPVEHELRGEL